YIDAGRKKSDIERVAEGRKKTGVATGLYAINHLTAKKMPIYVSDFVLASVGTGCVVGVPGHDIRDFEFAKEKGLEIIRVVVGSDGDKIPITRLEQVQEENGTMVNSDFLNGMNIHDATKAIMDYMEEKKQGKRFVNYKLHDWLISRQRYWGAPIPVIYCEKCGTVPVSEIDLPVVLPKNVDFIPRGKSPLHYVKNFMETKCPKCCGKATRESDTMDTFVDSSWYFLRYLSPKKQDSAFDKKIIKKWMPIDMYIGGSEHACMHLIYARFFTMVLHDLGFIDFDEPFKRLVHQGIITKNSAKMSKSKGNVVSPDTFIEKYGSDVFRMYLMFMGPYTAGGDWNDKGIVGVARFVKKFGEIMGTGVSERDGGCKDREKMLVLIHKTIKRVTESIEMFHFNTAIAAMMEFVNEIPAVGIDLENKKIMVRLLAPLAPHTAEELWEILGQKYSIFDQEWPKFDAKYLVTATIEIPVQVNGRLRGVIKVATGANKDDVLKIARDEPSVKKYLETGKIIKEIFIEGKLVGFVVK
ncbi:leucine--tRNA ligase, partial [Candidatus Peregrinibacteria bacterium]|nr:leucine--tRNA ligase [Candidatus Peregrinibacteria bacterium]